MVDMLLKLKKFKMLIIQEHLRRIHLHVTCRVRLRREITLHAQHRCLTYRLVVSGRGAPSPCRTVEFVCKLERLLTIMKYSVIKTYAEESTLCVSI